MLEAFALLLALAMMALGFVGAVIPALPSTPLVVMGAICHRLLLGEDGAAWWVILVLFVICLFSLALDYIATMMGARKMGATRAGVAGALVGLVVGAFAGLPGLLIGPFAGALLFEKVGGRAWDESGKAGVGAVVGLLAGALGKLVCCVAMAGLFLSHVVLGWFF